MKGNKTIGVLGGDRRQAYLARALAEEGWPVLASRMEGCPEAQGLEQAEPEELCGRCGAVVLPLPATRDGKVLFAPFAKEPVALTEGFAALFKGKRVLGGMLGPLLATSPLWGQADCQDYYEREELLVGNAVLTAEGAVGAAVESWEGAINGSRCLVTGFGRIGKALCLALRGLGARVDCCARKPKDRTAIRALGCGAPCYEEIGGGYDLIFNTVPAQVLGRRELERQQPGALLFELASSPGGIDLEAAEKLGLRVLPQPGLPGRKSPKAAGELIKEAVCNMMAY